MFPAHLPRIHLQALGEDWRSVSSKLQVLHADGGVCVNVLILAGKSGQLSQPTGWKNNTGTLVLATLLALFPAYPMT